MPFALLQLINRQLGELVAPESTSKEDSKQRPIAFAFKAFPVWCLPKGLSVLCSQPVAQPDAQFLHALDAPYSRGQIGAQEAAVCRLLCETPDSSKTEVDRTGGEMARLQVHPVADDNRLAERQPWFGAIPVHKLVNGMVIATLGVRAGQAVEDRGFRRLQGLVVAGSILHLDAFLSDLAFAS